MMLWVKLTIFLFKSDCVISSLCHMKRLNKIANGFAVGVLSLSNKWVAFYFKGLLHVWFWVFLPKELLTQCKTFMISKLTLLYKIHSYQVSDTIDNWLHKWSLCCMERLHKIAKDVIYLLWLSKLCKLYYTNAEYVACNSLKFIPDIGNTLTLFGYACSLYLYD